MLFVRYWTGWKLSKSSNKQTLKHLATRFSKPQINNKTTKAASKAKHPNTRFHYLLFCRSYAVLLQCCQLNPSRKPINVNRFLSMRRNTGCSSPQRPTQNSTSMNSKVGSVQPNIRIWFSKTKANKKASMLDILYSLKLQEKITQVL